MKLGNVRMGGASSSDIGVQDYTIHGVKGDRNLRRAAIGVGCGMREPGSSVDRSAGSGLDRAPPRAVARSCMSAPVSRTAAIGRALWVLVAVVVVTVAYRGLPMQQLSGETRFAVSQDLRGVDSGSVWTSLAQAWGPPVEGSSGASWQPATRTFFLLEQWTLRGQSAGLLWMQLLWLLLAVVGVQALARTLGAGRGGAIAAGLLFGLHPAVVEPASQLLARSELVAAVGVVWSLTAWLRARQARSRPGFQGFRRWRLVHLGALAVALGSAGTAAWTLPVLVVWSWLDRDRQGSVRWTPWQVRVRLVLASVAPAAVLVVAWAALRFTVLGADGWPAVAVDPLRWAVGLGNSVLRVASLGFDTGWRDLTRSEAVERSVWLPALLACIGGLAALAVAWRHRFAGARGMTRSCVLGHRPSLPPSPGAPPDSVVDPQRTETAGAALALGTWVLASLLPIALLADLDGAAAEGRIPLSDSRLLQAVAALVVLVPLLVRHVPARIRLIPLAFLVVWVAFSLDHSSDARAPYRSEPALLQLAEARYLTTPEAVRTPADRCRHATRRLALARGPGALEAVLAENEKLPVDCRIDAEHRFHVFAALAARNRTLQARAMLPDLLARPPAPRWLQATLLHLGGALLLETGEPADAVRLLRNADALGQRDCSLALHLGRGYLLTSQPARGAIAFERAARCTARRGKPTDPLLKLAAAQAWADARNIDRARQLADEVLKRADLTPEQRELAKTLRSRLSTGKR
jgi:hypothetical protein